MYFLMHEGHVRRVYSQELRIKYTNENGNQKPVQMWTSMWDSQFGRSHYLYFEDFL